MDLLNELLRITVPEELDSLVDIKTPETKRSLTEILLEKLNLKTSNKEYISSGPNIKKYQKLSSDIKTGMILKKSA